ncbi:STAS domain-containing protein [Streptomyces sp. NPDC091268]|uniref:STAS domain-containing protein n=1 Tax=Streptomyces sp. NPDC091268 TaxID=3365979 RepID=UPI0038279C2D
MDPAETGSLRIAVRCYGPTVHALLEAELDLAARPALARVSALLPEDVSVVACDLHHVSFMDVSGLHFVLDLYRRGRDRGAAVLFYNWQTQPAQLLGLALTGPNAVPAHRAGRAAGPGDAELRALRRALGEHAEARCALGVGLARDGLAGASRGRGTAGADAPPAGVTPAGATPPGPPPSAR